MRLDKLATKIVITTAYLTLIQLSGCVSNSQVNRDNGYLVATSEITENVDRFINKSVLVRNDVSQTLGTKGFILDKDRLIDGQPILVINISEIPLKTFDDNTPEILVEGIVERLNLDRIKQKYSLNLESELYSQYEGKPVIIATSLIPSPDPEDLTANPEIYYDQQLAIKGEVDDVEDYGIFEIDEEQAFGGEDLLVVQYESQVRLNEKQTVIVYGVLRQFIVEELQRDYNLDWDSAIAAQIKAEHDQKPILVTNKIHLLR